MATWREERQLTDSQIADLARAISSEDMETVAVGFLGIDEAVIINLRKTHWKDPVAFNREVLRVWTKQNEGNEQVQVQLNLVRKSSQL